MTSITVLVPQFEHLWFEIWPGSLGPKKVPKSTEVCLGTQEGFWAPNHLGPNMEIVIQA